jgi:photosystem II stability/assembly factor-like uncharacterized protein
MRRVRTRHFQVLTLAATAALFCGCASTAVSQTRRSAPATGAAYDTTFLTGLEWKNIGPKRGGRSIAAHGSESRPLEYYFGATGGGLWKTTDGGTTWNAVTDGQIGSASVGAVQVCQSNPDVVYIGMGEVQLRGNVQQGDGVYKSTDAGQTWTHLGLKEAQNIARIRIHPTNCDQVYVAAFGHHAAPNPERGVYRSADGGQTWQKTLYRDDKSGAVDLIMDPSNPEVLYASLWEAWRKPWALSSGGPGSGLFKSTDAGATWTELTRNPGLPTGMIGKIGVSVSGADPNRVYAIIEADSGGVFRSDDAGQTWKLVNDERKLRQRAFYYTRIYADPVEKDRVYVLNVGFFRSDDGGEKFDTTIRVPHGDNHDLWISSNDNQRMIEANDGGANVSVNGGKTWTEQDYPTAQMYRVVTTAHQPYFVCGGQQDNSTVCVPSRGWDHMTARGAGDYFHAAGGCESGYVAPHPKNTNIFYAGCYGGSLDRYDHATGQTRGVNVWPENPMGQSAEDLRERVQWTFPIIFSPHDPNVLYTSSQHVWRSTNEGQSWERISPDLTRADPSTMGPSGGPITKDQTGVETYATVFTLAPSPHEANTIWAGSDDGLIHVTRDGGQNWQNVTPQGLPEFTRISTVEASPHKPGTAYMAGNRYLLDDRMPYFYRTDDYGQTWTKIVNGIPDGSFARSIREDTKRPGLLYAATETGVFVSWDNGNRWQPLQRNLPTVQVSDIAVEENDLVIATHGRSFWIMPNIGPLRQMTPEVARANVHLFDPADPVRGVDDGVAVYYSLKKPSDKVTIEFLDSNGKTIQTFVSKPEEPKKEGEGDEDFSGPRQSTNPPAKAGVNRFTWNLRYPGYTEFPGMIMWAARNAGPVAVPGRYQVRLTANGQTRTQDFEVKMDPRIMGVTVADLQKRFDLAMQIRDKVTEANEAVLLIRGVKQQADSILAKTNDPQITQAIQSLTSQLSAVEGEIYQVRNRSNQDPLNFPIKINNKIAALLGHVEEAEMPPTQQTYEVFNHLSQQLSAETAKLNRILEQDLAQVNEQLRSRRLTPITRTPLKVEEDKVASSRDEAGAEGEAQRW